MEQKDTTKKWEENAVSEEQTEEKPSVKEKSWIRKTGQLAVDVYETEENIIIQSPVAGIRKEDLEIITEKDTVIIKGNRRRPEKEEIKNFYNEECFFGEFRREVILPQETDPSRIEANMEEGVLTVKIPKIEKEKIRKIDI